MPETMSHFAVVKWNRAYLEACVSVAFLAYITGWTNNDLQGFFATWGRLTLQYGPAGVYDKTWIDNGPLAPLLLSIPAYIESVWHVSDQHLDPFLFKAIPLLGLFAAPFVIRALVEAVGLRPKFTWIVVATVLNPALVYITAIWGQNDVLLFDLAGLAATMFLRGRPGLGGLFFVLDVMIKPTPILVLPVIFVLAIRSVSPAKAALGAACGLVVAIPEMLTHGARWLVDLYVHASQEYPYADVGAGTLAAILGGPGLPADRYHWLGVASAATVAIVVIVAQLRDAHFRSRAVWYLAICSTAVYWLAPRMHERYLTIGASFAIAWAFAAATKPAVIAASLLSLALMLQVVTNGIIDLGWGWNVFLTVNMLVPKIVWFTLYCTLNAAGLSMLLYSGLRQESPEPLPSTL